MVSYQKISSWSQKQALSRGICRKKFFLKNLISTPRSVNFYFRAPYCLCSFWRLQATDFSADTPQALKARKIACCLIPSILKLTDLGKECAKALAAKPSFEPIVARMREIKKTFGAKSGTFLKDLIYRLFDEEVGQRRMGRVIRK